MKKLICILTVFIIFNSCSETSPDDFIDSTPLPNEDITYTGHVKSIIDNNCLNCHSMPPENGAPMALVTYNQVKQAVQGRDLIGLISTQDLSEVMPLGGPRLPQNLIDIIVQWEIDGLIE
ncbi:MAG: hypothetical protein HKN00_05885 [Flavobacteriaceae bacterium]|nr:hypothetical protein [Flavobacteriaceae bacterium]